MSYSRAILLKNISLVTIVKLANNVLGIFRGIFIAASLSVEIYGAYKLIQIFIQYAGYLTLGISSAAARAISITIGAGDKKEFQVIQNTAFVFVIFIGCCISVLAITFYATGLNYESIFNWMLVVLFCLMVFGNKLNEFFNALLTSQSRFIDLSLSTILKGFISTVFVVVLANRFDIYGILTALLLGILSFILTAYFRLKPTFSFKPDFTKLKSLLKVGLSIVMLKEGHFVFWSTCTLLISRFQGLEQVGQFGFALSIITYIINITNAIDVVLYPKLGEIRGKYSYNTTELKKFIQKPVEYFFLLLVYINIFAFFLIPLIIIGLLDKYTQSIDLIKILIPGVIFLRMRGIFGSMMIIYEKQKYYFITQVISIIITISLAVWFLYNDYELIFIAFALSLGSFFYGIIIILLSYNKIFKKGREGVNLILKIVSPFLLILCAVYFIDKISYSDVYALQIFEGIIKTIVSLLISTLLTFLFFPKVDFRILFSTLKQIAVRKKK